MTLSSARSDEPGPVPLEQLAPGEVFAAVGSSPRGLSSKEAFARVAEHGHNELPSPHGRPVVLRFLVQFRDLYAVVLLVAAGLTLLAYVLGDPPDVGNLQLAIAILLVVQLNAVIGFGQEYLAERTAEALRAMVPHRARVVRDGERIDVPAAELTVGDLVVFEAGDAVSADCRVVEAHELAVNNMADRGEFTGPTNRGAGGGRHRQVGGSQSGLDGHHGVRRHRQGDRDRHRAGDRVWTDLPAHR